MARPKKSTVDYFPHDTAHGSTMQVLESKWGNDGYAFWFKLLELLGSHDNHYIDCRKPAEWEFMTAKTRIDDETAGAMLHMLAKLEAVDSFLWTKHKVIFCPKFLNRIEDAYRKRKDSFPTSQKVYSALNITLAEFPAEETPLNEQTDAGSTERERERERERESIKTTTAVEEKFIEAFFENESRIKTLYPHTDFDAQRETCIVHYRSGDMVLDPYKVILQWFNRIPKENANDRSGNTSRSTQSGTEKGNGKGVPSSAGISGKDYAGSFPDRSGEW